MRPRFVPLPSFLLFFALALPAGATEIMGYGGVLTHTATGGCCQSTGSKTGGGILGRFELKPFGTVDLLAYSDGRWSEGIAGIPFYIMGRPNRTDVGAGEMVEAFTVSNVRWISTAGAGYFSHTTKEKKFDLPTLVSGFVFSNVNQILYSLDDRWSVGAVLQLSIGISASDTSFLLGTHLGLSYNFK